MSDWPDRRRSEQLLADLADLEAEMPCPAGELAFASSEALLGALYVLEGSRLGGTLLKRSVPAEFPTRFLGNVDSAAWQLLLSQLDDHLDTELKRSTAIGAAQEVFSLFEVSGHTYLMS